MAPATTIGAAQPISITPEGTSDAGEKTRNFLARQAKSLAEEKDRPTDIALGFVENNVSLTSSEALEKGVIDYIAESLDDLLEMINGEEITKKSVTYTIDTDNYTLHYSSMSHTEAMQQFISNPQIAMLFMMLGIMGLYFGFSSPGTFVPEVLGAICLIIGIYGIGLFGTNTAGLVLLFAGVLLITAEIFTSGFGILGIGGIISMVIGALMLPVEPLMGEDWYGTFIRSILGFGIGIAVILIFVVQRVINTRRHLPLDKINLSFPNTGIVVKELNPQGMVRAKGELWKATSADESHIPVGTEVNVIRKDSLTLWVEPLNKAKEE
jgi:membrane-bound serine protease (ClpP class)